MFCTITTTPRPQMKQIHTHLNQQKGFLFMANTETSHLETILPQLETILPQQLDIKGHVFSKRSIQTTDRLKPHDIVFSASEFDKSRTGIHAMVQIHLDGFQVAYDTINTGKALQRNSICKVAYDNYEVENLKDVYPRLSMQTDMMNFCFNAYETYVNNSVEMEDMIGDPMLEVGYYVPGIVPKGGGSFISARPGQGKSYIVMAMAVSVDANVNHLWNVTQGKVLYINLERSKASMKKRLGSINQALGLDYDRPLPFLNIRGKTLSDVSESVKKIIAKNNIKLLIVDSISRAGMGSLIEDGASLKVTDMLNNLVEGTDRSWLAIAHRGHSDTNMFGSIMQIGAADIVAKVESSHNDNSEMGLKLEVEKQNDSSPYKPTVIALGFDAIGLTTIRRSSLQEFPDLMDEQLDNRTRIIKYLRGTSKSAKDIAEELGIKPNTVFKVLDRGDKTIFKRMGTPGYWGLVS